MARAGPEALAPLQPLLRQLRELKGVREELPGRFVVRREPFVQFHVDDDAGGRLHAEMKKPGGSGWDRYGLDDAAQQRRFLEDAKLRARRLDDPD